MAELLTNTGIETAGSPWQTWFSSCTLARVSTQAHSGSWSLSLAATGANTYIGANDSAVDVTEGTVYTASWWVYLADTATYTPIVQPAGGGWQRYGTAGSITANTWTQVSVTGFTAGAWTVTTDDFMFRLDRSTGTYSGQTLYWDDFSLTSQERRSSLLLGV